MASATVSRKNDEAPLTASRRHSLGHRILAVNLFALLMLAGGVLYLDSFRDRLLEERRGQAQVSAALMAEAVGAAKRAGGEAAAAATAWRLGAATGARVRVYDASGQAIIDSWRGGTPTFRLRDPETEPWRKDAARFLDRVIETIGSARSFPPYAEPQRDVLQAWPEAEAARGGAVAVALRRAPDRTVIVSAATTVPGSDAVLLMTSDTRDITRVVRSERATSFVVFLGVLTLSLALSLFLARTIVRPLRRLSLAAHRVRMGRAREVVVPRFAKRRDEIGVLARALADMTQALRQRTDATEAFAADVTHEIKNPLASLRSAVETLDSVQDPALRTRLLDVVRDDVRRIDRLVSDIAEVSRLDAELARSRFEKVDLGQMVATLAQLYERDASTRDVEIAFARPEPGTAIVLADEQRLAQVARNLIDNALSFSPPGGLVCIRVTGDPEQVTLRIDDDGPGIPAANIEDIFKRFYSERPDGEDFGRHSGLGLAIARAVVEAHDGSIGAENRIGDDGHVAGARFVVRLPAAT